jgi:hypothetical protein
MSEQLPSFFQSLASIDVQAKTISELLDALDNAEQPQVSDALSQIVRSDCTFELRCTSSRENRFQIKSDNTGHLSMQDQSAGGIREKLVKWIHRKLHHDVPKLEEGQEKEIFSFADNN